MLEQIYEKYYGTMLYIADNILHDRALAEDAVSESFIKLTPHLEKFQDISGHQTRGYIVKVVKTVSYDIYNKRVRRDEIEEDFSAADKNVDILTDLVSQENYDSIKKIIHSLPDRLKDVLLLCASGYSHDEIAKALNITVSNSKKRLSRARELVKKKLGGKRDGK